MSKMLKWLAFTLGVAALTPRFSALALDASATDARAILQAAVDQLGGERGLSRMKMTIRQGASTRERVMSVRSWRAAQARKVLILIEAPSDVRNTGFLSLNYADATQPDEQWLYLPALHRVSRVPNSGQSDAFVGSDFSISDLSGQEPSELSLRLLEPSVKLGDEECWLIESLPRDEQIKAKTGYSKVQLWISKSKQLVLQSKAWTLDPTKIKYFKASDVRRVDGLWTPHRLQMRTLTQGKEPSETVIDVLSVQNRSPEVTEADFSAARLERGL